MPRAQPSFDERTTALANGSRRIFESARRVGGHGSAKPAPIRRSTSPMPGRFGFARLEASRAGRRGVRLRRGQPRASARRCGRQLRAAPELTCACRRACTARTSPRRRCTWTVACADGAPHAVPRAPGGRGRRWRALGGARRGGHRRRDRGLRAGGASWSNVPTDRPHDRALSSASPRTARWRCCRCDDGALAVVWAVHAGAMRSAAGAG